MNDESGLLAKRFLELSHKSGSGGYYLFSDFLGLAELSVLEGVRGRLYSPVTLFGGAEGAERVIAAFGDEEEIGYPPPFPIVCIKAEPKSARFAERLTHRDFLGALMNLGIERDTLGDIIIRESVGYIFASEKIAPFILSSLARVRNTDMTLSVCESLPEGALYTTERITIQISSERLDAIIARAFHLSREAAQAYFGRKLVFVDGRLCESPSHSPREGQTVSVRGLGRLVWHGSVGLTKKGKLNCTLDLYK
ncbi:MAG: hypothetical protein IKA64_00380 [Clostridia bacterium]|nr:hypothetical protein [Clostridia bacterium]